MAEQRFRRRARRPRAYLATALAAAAAWVAGVVALFLQPHA